MLIYVSCGMFRRAIELLLSLDRPVTAALFLNACVEARACEVTRSFDDERDKNAISVAFATRVFAAYARYLQKIGLDVPSSRLHSSGIALETD